MTQFKVISARVYCAGVKVRCRKLDKHVFRLGDFPIETFDEATVVSQAVETVKKQMKSLYPQAPVKLSLSEDKIEERDGLQIRTFLIATGHRSVDITESFRGGLL